MSDGKSTTAQGNRVRQELEILRQRQLAKNQRDKLKDLRSPLTTPEEAEAFLAAMRDKSHEREYLHKPPSNLSADGIDTWYIRQRQREKELRKRRQEAEQLLRGYRARTDEVRYSSGSKDSRKKNRRTCSPLLNGEIPLSPSSIAESDTLDDPLTFKQEQQQQNTSFQFDVEKEGEEKDDCRPDLPATEIEEKKLDDHQEAAIGRAAAAAAEPEYVEETIWRSFISFEPGAKFRPEANRYHLYVSYACPGSHRALIVRSLKGLEDCVSVTYVHPTWRLTKAEDPTDRHRGWVFGDPAGEPFPNTIGRGGPFPAAYPGNEPDPHLNAFSVREIYERAGDTSCKYTIPMLWDTHLNTIVNNDSSDIAYMLNSCFNHFATNPELDLYTEYDADGMAKLNEVSEWLSPLMIHGVYRCGFAKTQVAYDKAIVELCDAFDRADEILQSQRYLTGDTLTDADIRLFVTLIRFDEVYAFYFKANARMVMLTPSLMNFCREIYQIPGVADTCNMEQIKAHFYGSHAEWNKYSVIPRGLGFMELLELPHDRDQFAKSSTDEDMVIYTAEDQFASLPSSYEDRDQFSTPVNREQQFVTSSYGGGGNREQRFSSSPSRHVAAAGAGADFPDSAEF